jgi:hypothetical protein
METCIDCRERPGLICCECMRALALIDQPSGFAGIARHPEAGVDCRICARGAAASCPECFCSSAAEQRRLLLGRAGWRRRSLAELAGDGDDGR